MANSYSQFGSMSEKSGVQNWKTTDGLYFQDEQFARWHQEYLDEQAGKSSSGRSGGGGGTNGLTVWTLSNGDRYAGYCRNGYPDGHGKMEYADGDVYEGYWSNNQRTKGKYTWTSGEVYEGEWATVNGRNNPHGYGKRTYPDGSVYEGDWANIGGKSKKHGKGKQTYANGNVYEGDWVDGKRHGKGKIIWKQPNICKEYEGEFVEDKKNGKGKYTLTDGRVFEGVFDGNDNGQGIMTYPNGKTEKGVYDDKTDEFTAGSSSSSAPNSGGSSNQSSGISSERGKIGRITEGTFVCPDDESIKVTIKIKGDKIILTDSTVGNEEVYTYGEEEGWTIFLIDPYKHEIVPEQIEIRDNGMMFFRGEKYIKK